MTTRRLVLPAALSFAVLVATALPLGCGGRTLSPQQDAGTTGGATGAGTAGTTSGSVGGSTGMQGSGGTSGGAGTVGPGGFTGAGGSVGIDGPTGAAGSQVFDAGPACGPCPQALCKDGFISVVDPAVSCCPVCRPINCAAVDCAQPQCSADAHLETPPGKCCPICVAGPPTACVTGRLEYAQTREQIIEKYGYAGCMADTDCTIVPETNACQAGCGIAMAISMVGNLEGALSTSSMGCSTCPPPTIPPCLPIVAVCSNGRCEAAGGPGH